MTHTIRFCTVHCVSCVSCAKVMMVISLQIQMKLLQCLKGPRKRYGLHRVEVQVHALYVHLCKKDGTDLLSVAVLC